MSFQTYCHHSLPHLSSWELYYFCFLGQTWFIPKHIPLSCILDSCIQSPTWHLYVTDIKILSDPRRHLQTFSTCSLPILVGGSYTHLVAWSETLKSFLTPFFHTHIHAVSKHCWLCFQNTTKTVSLSLLCFLQTTVTPHLHYCTPTPHWSPCFFLCSLTLFSIQQLKCDPFQISSTQNLPVVSHQNSYIWLKGPYLLLLLWTCQWFTRPLCCFLDRHSPVFFVHTCILSTSSTPLWQRGGWLLHLCHSLLMFTEYILWDWTSARNMASFRTICCMKRWISTWQCM